VQYKGKFSVGPTEDFASGFGISGHVACGSDFQLIASSLPDYVTHSPVCYSIEIGLKDPEQGPMIVATMNQMKEMFGEMIPQLKQALGMGLEIHFRNVANSIFVDLTVSGALGAQVAGAFGMFNVGNSMFSGNSNFHITSGWMPMGILSETLEQNILKGCHLRLEGSGEFSQIKVFINSLTNVLVSQQHMIPPKMKPLLFGLKLFSALRKYEFDLKYSATDLLALVKDAIEAAHGAKHHGHEGEAPGTGFQEAAAKFTGVQMMGNMFVEQGKGMVMFIADYMEILKSINLDCISLNFSLSNIKLFYKISLHLPGVSAWLNENFFN